MSPDLFVISMVILAAVWHFNVVDHFECQFKKNMWAFLMNSHSIVHYPNPVLLNLGFSDFEVLTFIDL